jgi:hypothetical protein
VKYVRRFMSTVIISGAAVVLVCSSSTSVWAGAVGIDGGNVVSIGASSSSNAGISPGDQSSNPSSSGLAETSGSNRESHKPSPGCVLAPVDSELAGAMGPGGSTPGQWYAMWCNGQEYIPSTGMFWIPDSKAPVAKSGAGPVDPLVLAEQAYRTILLPSPSIHTNPSPYTVVNLPTWLWVTSAAWHPLEATASAGAVTATAVATPSSVTWSMGDGSTVVCRGPGTAYDPNEPAVSQSTDCSYTYTQSSAGQPSSDGNPDDGAYQVSATITWSVTWKATGAPGGGELPALETASTAPLRVEQIESVGTAS